MKNDKDLASNKKEKRINKIKDQLARLRAKLDNNHQHHQQNLHPRKLKLKLKKSIGTKKCKVTGVQKVKQSSGSSVPKG